MDIEQLKAAFAGISSLSAIVSGYKSALDIGRHYSERDVTRAEEDASRKVESIPPEELVRGLLIQQDILEPMVRNIYDAKEKLKKSIADAERPKTQRLRDMDEADSAICFWLQGASKNLGTPAIGKIALS